MLPKASLVGAVLLLAALSGSSCSDRGATAPSPLPPPSDPPQSPTPPPPPGDFSQLAGTWNLDFRLTEITAVNDGGTGCVLEEMRSQIEVPRPYTLSISDTGSVKLTNLSTNHSWWVAATTTDGLSFTPYGYCSSDVLVFRCSNGTQHRLISACGGGILGRLSGNEISGTWGDCLMDLAEDEGPGNPGLHLRATFSGRR